MARNRLTKEYREISRLEDVSIKLEASPEDLHDWNAYLKGPEGSPYAGGTFTIRLQCPSQYPLSPPTVTFVTRCFHPNVNFETGELCLDILKTDWSPAWSLISVCRAVVALLHDPNADSPLNCDAGNLIRSGDMLGFRTLAAMYTKEHAT
uniref:Ubiqtuitin carrier protein n=2 Tax=Chromera velia TaxID=505693 RepID=A0A2K8DNS6_9ALVE|nr:ubiqtuitin carrier protein [Chromera velia]|mmetsp:Transcript_21617/g.43003  ORF Transcript_21617/g.43003 Transcript_21617/m.43003 type:complete len:150 (+) Transcript_21617:207-656(+)|eukprot:Cvel_7548.t1-p1 / transcript=Cvel_7548.t1 / gene=Cvel_7548 / organism=Chromera_velia_CCMP2878 / gene_product=Protein PEROXIN-4, putative / transcript_product=Protein PEROXIN-4, putative / location=Cvel_scaffold397:6274-8615(+) / protein_length=149 / sequence_SO=supercontig / SO=protein_coding / is_pseudo=false